MADIETDSIVSLITSLLNSFRQVPPAAIPAMIDCVIASTSLSPSSVLSLLFNAFPNLTKDIMKESGKLDSEDSNYIGSIVAAFCCLLKKSGANTGALQLFIWKFFIPLMKLVHDYNLEILNEIVESFFDVVIGTNTWVVVEVTLVPFFLRLVGLSMGMLHSEDLAIYKWSRHSAPLGFDDQLNELDMDEEFMLSKSVSFPLRVSCHILTSILNAALLSQHAAGSISESILVNGSSAETISGNLLWDLCNMTIRMLSQDSEHRSAAMGLLLPTIFKAFVSNCSFEISTHGQTYILSRNHLFTEIWKCCRILFSLGPLERKDAYGVLSLHLSFFSYISGCEDVGMGERDGGFDLRAEKEFWEEIKRGLVDKEGLVRKHSLHILKMALHINEGSQCYNGVSETISSGKDSAPLITKREMWADKEAKSLGVGKICHSAESSLNSQQKWGAFLLLYEMLEEYGTHLVEAAWNRQITLLLHLSFPHDNSMNSITGEFYQNQMDMLGGIFIWLAVLWERGFCHHNPQVRCLIMQSFLGIEWKTYGNNAKLVPEEFVIGPLIEGLNDPVHHKDFGIKGVYSSRTIQGATKFLCHYTTDLSPRKRIAFLNNLASVAKQQSFGRAGLMCFAECIASAACGVQTDNGNEVECCKGAFPDMVQVESDPGSSSHSAKTDLVEDLRYVIETSKRHFNSNYRLRVCEKVLEAAASVICASELSLEILLHFISILPREFTDYGGSLRIKVHKWLLACGEKHRLSNFCCPKVQLLKNICDFPRNFTSHDHSLSGSGTFDDEDLDAWAFEAERWARVLFLVIKGEHHIDPILTFIKNHGVDGKRTKHLEWVPVRFLILVLSLIQELQIIQERMAVCGIKRRTRLELGLPEIVDHLSSAEASVVVENFTELLFSILEELISFARSSSLIFWSNMVDDTFLPCSIRGKLGGPSQRRLSSSTTTAVLQAITSVKVVASISLWCSKFRSDVLLNFAFNFLWQFFWKIVSSSKYDSETEAEIFLASYEALAYVSKALASTFSSFSLNLLMENDKPSTPVAESRPLLDSLVITFLQNINNLIAVGKLVRSRRAILINWKWICMESLLSIPTSALMNGVRLESGYSFFSDATVRWIFSDLVDSLENAGEGSVLHMLRSVRLVLELFASGKTGPVLSSCNGVDAQMMWHLVRASWILHISCNKRRVAPIAALLSSVLHYSVFVSECMHETDNAPGPVKWFVEKILEEGTKSPRTIRLAALHLTGLWLSTPRTIKYYMKELKLLTLYGSVAFDEDFEAEIADNHDARSELSALGKSPDPELTEAFINTELYARVSVAVLFNKLADLADMVGSDENENCFPALESGKLFLLELLDSVVNDNDLAKELYKKYSGIHRRKVRAWQMICILARFIDQDILQRVIHSLHIALHRNNLPAVRQYLETFAIHMYLKFPSLVGEHLVPVLRDYDMRPQTVNGIKNRIARALSSYVFIAANVILHSTEAVQSRRLDELLPPIIPLLTSHHHSLRGFTQLLVYQVLHKVLPPLDSSTSEIMPLEKRCFEDLKLYLGKNSDCARLRASMEGYLDAFNPRDSVTPAGIFANRVEEDEFECVSISLMDQVIAFLNDVREDLRCSMAKDAVNIKNESLRIDDLNCMEVSVNSSKELPKEVLMDFQKKITFSKHEAGDTYSNFFSGSNETYKRLMEMQKEDQLLDQLLHSRSLAMEKLRASRQDFILVASLLDRIPNLAGLARTCEVFKAAGLAIADANILHDKQFQLISVTAEKWVPIIEVPVSSVKIFLEKKKREGFSILGLEQTANSIPLDQYSFPKKTVLVLGREKEGIPVELIHILDACIEIPQLGVVRSLNVHVSGAIALWEYTRQQISR